MDERMAIGVVIGMLLGASLVALVWYLLIWRRRDGDNGTPPTPPTEPS